MDLAIALAILRTSRPLGLDATACIGELALDGGIRPVAGVLPMARCLLEHGVRRLVVAEENAAEAAALVEGVAVHPARHLAAAVAHLEGERPISPVEPPPLEPGEPDGADLAAVRGQTTARRALEIAAAGGHNLLMVGPPGSGKTMLARSLPGILPDLGTDEALEVAGIYSLRGAFGERAALPLRPPFRAPHHSVSRAGLVGGGSVAVLPGEISLASHGVLFLDEICEFPRSHLESLRQPLEERRVTIVRARGGVVLPASFMLVAAANPCPCGHLDDPGRPCRCAPQQLHAYRGRLSGPLRDRIDLVVAVPRLPASDLLSQAGGEPSAAVRARVVAARRRQHDRALEHRMPDRNALLSGSQLTGAGGVTPKARQALVTAAERLGLSARAVVRVLRVGRTIADLAGDDGVGEDALAEALRYRGERAA